MEISVVILASEQSERVQKSSSSIRPYLPASRRQNDNNIDVIPSEVEESSSSEFMNSLMLDPSTPELSSVGRDDKHICVMLSKARHYEVASTLGVKHLPSDLRVNFDLQEEDEKSRISE